MTQSIPEEAQDLLSILHRHAIGPSRWHLARIHVARPLG